MTLPESGAPPPSPQTRNHGAARDAIPGESPLATRLAHAANGLVLGIARHWLALFNLAFGLYVLLPLLAPLLLHAGLPGAARPIYTIYSFTCHQIPDHSYFLFGPTLAPSQAELIAAGMDASPNLFVQRLFRGNEQVGYKVALCQRDIAIYGAIALGGLLYALLRRRIRPLPGKIFLLFLIPMAIDGGTQLIGLRESTWWLRTLTGALFGLGGILWIYPYVDDAMLDVVEEEIRKNASQT